MTNICMPLLNAESSMKIYKCAPRGWPITTSTGDGGMGYIQCMMRLQDMLGFLSKLKLGKKYLMTLI